MPTKGNEHISFRMNAELISELAVSHFEWSATAKGEDKSVSHFIRTLLFRAIRELARKRRYNLRGRPQELANPQVEVLEEVIELAPEGVTVAEADPQNWMLPVQESMDLQTARLESNSIRESEAILRYEQGK